ncbi:MAG TPA: ABC transporter permease, partial [Puia sp.]|nr:ABC transporter permease [Puia sp.]
KSYWKTAIRFLLKNKTFSFINVFGLAAGTFCCLYILLYVQDQYSYDKHHADAKDIYRVNRIDKAQGGVYNLAITAAPMTPLMKRDFPEIKQYTRVIPYIGVDKHLISYGEKHLWIKDGYIVDSTFFDVFTYRSVRGDLRTALYKPNTVVLLKPLADELFGREDPIGKTITLDNTDQQKVDYTVMAVAAEGPGKSHLQATFFTAMNSEGLGRKMMHWDSWVSETFLASYIKLQPGSHPAALEKKFPAFEKKYAGPELKKWNTEETLYLQPIGSIHTTGGLDNPGIGTPIEATFLSVLVLIAILIQVIACINFMNLATAHASKRAREVGVRKVIGAGKRDLIRQFLAETFLLASVAVLIAVPLLLLALSWLNGITGSSVTASFLSDYRIWGMLAGFVFLTGLVAGAYPAFYLSAFNAIRVLKGNYSNHVSVGGIRRALVVLQFVLSIVLITGIIVIYSQLNYIKNKDLGFDKDQRMLFTFNSSGSFEGLPAFLDDVRRLAGVKEVSNASKPLGSWAIFNNSWMLPGKNMGDQHNADYVFADKWFIKANGIKLISGRDFREGDSDRVLVNETFARKLGLNPFTAPGTKLHDSQQREVEIVGVMKDFNFWSLHHEVEGFMVWINNPRYGLWPTVIAHTRTTNYKQLLAKMEAVWHKDVPGVPFEYSFLDEEVNKLYETDITLSRIINSFTLMAIVISCLGLFGLAAFNAELRTKEIGIRKVLGASITGITTLLSTGFLKLIGIAFVIAVPIAWWAMNRWLQTFAFRISVSWWMFGIAGLMSVLIAMLTVGFHAIKAAVANPVRSLRAE